MSAYQYFWQDGQVIGRARVGTKGASLERDRPRKVSRLATSGVADGLAGSATACARTPPYQGTRPGPFGMKIFTPERAGCTPQ